MITPDLFDRDTQKEVFIGGMLLSHIAEEYSTPFYIYDAEIIFNRFEKISRHFESFKVFYSLKANPSLSITSYLRAQGANAEVASRGELHTALRAGFAPEQILFVGPGKSDKALRESVEQEISCIVAESSAEIRKIESICVELDSTMDILVRVNSQMRAESTVSETMSGGPSKFGIDEDTFVEELTSVSFDRTHLLGIHAYTASQVLDEESLLATALHNTEFAVEAFQKLGFELKVIDFGGGFGVPYTSEDKPLDIQYLAKKWEEMLVENGIFNERGYSGFQPILELGRYLTAQSGIYVTKVLYVKESQGQKFVITDGGINHQGRPMLMGGIEHPVKVLGSKHGNSVREATIVGPLCTNQDTLLTTSLPEVEPGDLIGVFNSGAYGLSYSLLNFLSHPWPSELLVINGEVLKIRDEGQLDDILRCQNQFDFSD